MICLKKNGFTDFVGLKDDGIAGLETIQERRGQKTDKPVLLNGPGKVSPISILNLHITSSQKVESVSN